MREHYDSGQQIEKLIRDLLTRWSSMPHHERQQVISDLEYIADTTSLHLANIKLAIAATTKSEDEPYDLDRLEEARDLLDGITTPGKENDLNYLILQYKVFYSLTYAQLEQAQRHSKEAALLNGADKPEEAKKEATEAIRLYEKALESSSRFADTVRHPALINYLRTDPHPAGDHWLNDIEWHSELQEKIPAIVQHLRGHL
jgi:hypothetical protein